MPNPQEELRAAVAILTAVHGMLSNPDAALDNTAAVQALVTEHWPDSPADAIGPLSYVALRAVSISAQQAGTTPAAILTQLGAETSGPPQPV
ncbi:hypothetical protein [Streptomyces mirabilis]|uniref:hypothetical protein n=1 Tax=Streptomyces mirabilis TaxID=68239 RepID=UPI003654DE75